MKSTKPTLNEAENGNKSKPLLGEVKLNFKNKGIPEEFKIVVIKYRYRNSDKNAPKYELGSAYYHNGWWVNFHNPCSFSENYEVLAWAEYNFT